MKYAGSQGRPPGFPGRPETSPYNGCIVSQMRCHPEYLRHPCNLSTESPKQDHAGCACYPRQKSPGREVVNLHFLLKKNRVLWTRLFYRLDRSGLIIASPPSILIFVLPLPAFSIGLLPFPPVLRSFFLALRPWCVLLTLFGPRLLPLITDFRASLLRR